MHNYRPPPTSYPVAVMPITDPLMSGAKLQKNRYVCNKIGLKVLNVKFGFGCGTAELLAV